MDRFSTVENQNLKTYPHLAVIVTLSSQNAQSVLILFKKQTANRQSNNKFNENIWPIWGGLDILARRNKWKPRKMKTLGTNIYIRNTLSTKK